jgi:hypothetical protein
MQQCEGQIANNQSQNGMSEVTSHYAYSQRTEFETHGAPQAVPTLGGFEMFVLYNRSLESSYFCINIGRIPSRNDYYQVIQSLSCEYNHYS